MKKRFTLACVCAFLLIIVTACNGAGAEGSDSTSQEQITLKFAVSQPETHTMHTETFKPFMDKVTEMTDGQVTFEYYPAEQLGKAADLLELTSDGVTDIGIYYASYYPSKMPITDGLLGLPGIYSSAYEGSMTYHELSKQSSVLESDYLNNGVRPLFILAPPPSELWTIGKEIKVPEDLKGMKVRVTGDLLNKAVTSLGASPINIALPELYEGLERGVFDSINQNPVSISDYGLGELIKYGTDGVSFGGVSAGFVINEKVFKGLPENVQEILVQVGDEVTESTAKFYDDDSQRVVQGFREDGINVYELSEDEKAEWHKFYGEIEENWVKKQNNPDLESTIDTFRKEAEKYK